MGRRTQRVRTQSEANQMTKKCPRCGSRETENSGVFDLIDSDLEGDLVTWRARCLRCGHTFGYDELIPRTQKETR